MDTVKMFKCLADKSRLLIINALREKPMYVELLAERLDLSSSTISFHLKKLEDVGLVSSKKEQYYMIYELNEEHLNKPLSKLIFTTEDIDQKVQEERLENYRQKVLKAFFEYGKLKSIPVQQKKRRIVLEELAKGLEVNKIYKERDINIYLADFNDDFCTLRREMVAEGILTREQGEYQLGKDFPHE